MKERGGVMREELGAGAGPGPGPGARRGDGKWKMG